jgi:tRNA(Ile)-lysidine synthase
MHIIRGSGVQGLRGIQQVSERRIGGIDVTLFRPILGLSKQDTSGYCTALDLEPRFDESNMSEQFTRNKVRQRLVPLLEEINPAFKVALLRLSRNADDAAAIVDRAVDAAWSEVATEDDEGVVLDRSRFRELGSGMQAQVVMRAMTTVCKDAQGVERIHIEDAVGLITGSTGTELHLPDGFRLTIEGDSAILFEKGSAMAAVPLPSVETSTLRVPGVTVSGGWRITARLVGGLPATPSADATKTPAAPDGLLARFGSGVDELNLVIRTRVSGDRFQPLGMSGTKKLKVFYIDEHVPAKWKDRVPLVVSPRGIAWVVGWRIAEWAKVREDDAEHLEIEFEEMGPAS